MCVVGLKTPHPPCDRYGLHWYFRLDFVVLFRGWMVWYDAYFLCVFCVRIVTSVVAEVSSYKSKHLERGCLLTVPLPTLFSWKPQRCFQGQWSGWMVRHGISMVGIGPPGPSREYLNPVSSMGAVRVVEIRSLTLLAVDLLHSTT